MVGVKEYFRLYRSIPENREKDIARKRETYPRIKAKHRVYRAKRYGLSVEEADKLWSAPCGLCGRLANENPPLKGGYIGSEIDHNHITGKVRGALCRDCNTAIGSLEKLLIARGLLEKALEWVK